MTRRPSFDQFYDETYDAVLKFAWLIGGNASSAEDAVQDAYLALINRYDRIEKPAAYLRIVVVNNL
ncbi:MAG: Sigma-70 region 2, partial [Ilumatobacteraceae bacterium]|nr:Sigma-70 region 2 [Ilumatobacteraceae bacterium]